MASHTNQQPTSAATKPIILAGLPGSGASYLATILADNPKVLVLPPAVLDPTPLIREGAARGVMTEPTVVTGSSPLDLLYNPWHSWKLMLCDRADYRAIALVATLAHIDMWDWLDDNRAPLGPGHAVKIVVTANPIWAHVQDLWGTRSHTYTQPVLADVELMLRRVREHEAWKLKLARTPGWRVWSTQKAYAALRGCATERNEFMRVTGVYSPINHDDTEPPLAGDLARWCGNVTELKRALPRYAQHYLTDSEAV